MAIIKREFVLHGYVATCTFGDTDVFTAPVYAINKADAYERAKKAVHNTYEPKDIKHKGGATLLVETFSEYKKRKEKEKQKWNRSDLR